MLNSSFQSHRFYVRSWSVALAFFFLSLVAASAQSVARIDGKILDPSGAVIPRAEVTLTSATLMRKVESGSDGSYIFPAVPANSYALDVSAKGFASVSQSGIVLAAGEVRHLIVSLTIAVEQQQVTVNDESQGVGLSPDQNASARVIKGRDLDALSDDPDELQNELQALAGSAAGPNGGQIYIDGFTGGQLPPKSSILEVRVNQNPFSAEFDRMGYGRIEIITKPGTQKLHGSISGFGTDPVLNTSDPLLPYKPSYDLSSYSGNLNGPLTKNSSYFLNFFQILRQAQNVVDAVNPQNTSANLQEAFPNSWNRIYAPADGVIGDKQAEVGMQVQPGQELCALTEINDVWVTANFKETQIKRMRAGQPVTIHVDALAQDFDGYVEALPGASGAVYSLLPPENATGNYVKVVQRLPVRIRFRNGQRGIERLAPGMSVEPKVWVH